MNWTGPIAEALSLPGGARFFKCALHVNPYAYVKRHAKDDPYANETAYNKALIAALQEHGVEVIAVADHYRVGTCRSLIEAARSAGLYVFPGFEATTKDGIHMLCIFDADKSFETLERILGACGIQDERVDSPTGDLDVRELLSVSRTWGSICVAAHVAGDKGLLATLKGQQRIKAWNHPNLLAASLPGPVQAAPESLLRILQNNDAQHRRDRPVAIVNATDIDSPEDVANAGASCWIKMSSPSIDGLRLAFLDPTSRVRLATDPEPQPHAEFLALAWQGGFLDGCSVRFNENLNVLIGGRGTGKSTVIESLRSVLGLQPLGEDSAKVHEGMIRHVLRSGTKISLAVRSQRPAPREYLIERTIPNPPVVRDDSGSVMELAPRDVIPGVEVYGQHEISELAKKPDKLTRLLDRFADIDPDLSRKKREIKQRLERSRSRITEVRSEQEQTTERLAALPAIEETLKRYQEAGLEERLGEQSLLVREERVLNLIGERITPIKDALHQLDLSRPSDRTFLSKGALADLPGRRILSRGDAALEKLEQAISSAISSIGGAIDEAEKELADVRAAWGERKARVQEAYEKILRELQKSRVDGEEFIRLRRQIEELRPLQQRESALQSEMTDLQNQRRTLLAEWEDTKATEFQQLDRTAKRVNSHLRNRVRAEVTFAGDRTSLLQLLRDQVGGRISEALTALTEADQISLKELADACRTGANELVRKFKIPSVQAERLAQGSLETLMSIEELDLPPTTRIELNVASEDESAAWRDLDELSTGQKATAVLLLLLLETDAPLVVDQPEDDLDNRFITQGVVPRIREEKRRRQFVFATHNANIPVLGDAELIVGLEAAGEALEGHALMRPEHMASIDSRPIRELVEELLEGGREAFETRRIKYGF